MKLESETRSEGNGGTIPTPGVPKFDFKKV